MKSYQSEVPTYEFEVMLKYMTRKVAELGMGPRFDQLALADILIGHDVTTLDKLADVVSLARNLQSGVSLATSEGQQPVVN
jgi:hypothetical protein